MRMLFFMLFTGLIFSCNDQQQVEDTSKISFNKALSDELREMVELDQLAANILSGRFEGLSLNDERWLKFKDSVFTAHRKRLGNIFEKYGFPNKDLVEKEGAHNFWLMVQHLDQDIAFQENILRSMEVSNKV